MLLQQCEVALELVADDEVERLEARAVFDVHVGGRVDTVDDVVHEREGGREQDEADALERKKSFFSNFSLKKASLTGRAQNNSNLD